MATLYEKQSRRRQARKALVGSVVALLLGGALTASAAWSLPSGPGVRAGNNITVFHEIDMVAAYGYPIGEPITVEVFRNGVKVGTAGGPAQSTADGGGLEVNHGPIGPPRPGDCWDNLTPDVLPGDRIVVTGEGGTDEVLVDDITVTTGPTDDTSTADNSDVYLEGHGSFADGTPIPAEQLSGELRQGSRYRVAPNAIERIEGTEDGWRATYRFPYDIERNRDGLNAAEQKQAILNNAHSVGYGHAAPLPAETQIADFPAANGPAPGCEGSPQQANAVATADDDAVNLDSGDLVLGGTALADTASVTGTVGDGVGVEIPFDATASLSAGPGQKTWTATIARSDLEQLSDGTLIVAAQYAGTGATIGGRELRIPKDLIAPASPTATPPAGSYDRRQAVNLQSEPGSRIHFTTNGADPTPSSPAFGPQVLITASQTIKAIAVDAAGNQSDVGTFEYILRQPSSVSLRMPSSDLRLGNSRTITGKVSPAHPRRSISLLIERDGSRVISRRLDLDAGSSYGFVFRPRKVGRYSVKVGFAGDADHKPSEAAKAFRVID